MSVFHSSQKNPYFAISLSSKLLLDHPTHYIMAIKVHELAKVQPGYLGTENSSDEIHCWITYWQTKQAAEAWLNHEITRKFLSLGENVWFQEYSIKLLEVLGEKVFQLDQISLDTSRFPKVMTKHGVLKVLDESQANLLYDYVNQEKEFLELWEPERSDGYYSFETCKLRIREMRRDFLEGKGVVFCLLSSQEDRMLAYSNYSNFRRGICQVCDLGYSLRESEQGKGVMYETLLAGTKYVQEELKISRIQASYMPRNAKSAAVLKKMGFEEEGVARNYLKINGTWENHVLTALISR